MFDFLLDEVLSCSLTCSFPVYFCGAQCCVCRMVPLTYHLRFCKVTQLDVLLAVLIPSSNLMCGNLKEVTK